METGFFRIAGVVLFASLGCTPAPEAPRPAPLAVDAPAAASLASPAERVCQKDADCTYAALGCCSVVAVNRLHADAVRARLRGSHLPLCPPKAACGPGPGGTWDGADGRCSEGLCSGAPDTP